MPLTLFPQKKIFGYKIVQLKFANRNQTKRKFQIFGSLVGIKAIEAVEEIIERGVHLISVAQL